MQLCLCTRPSGRHRCSAPVETGQSLAFSSCSSTIIRLINSVWSWFSTQPPIAPAWLQELL